MFKITEKKCSHNERKKKTHQRKETVRGTKTDGTNGNRE